MVLLELDNGKKVSIDSNGVTQDEALEIARKLVDSFGAVHPHVNVVLFYEADVPEGRFSECPHYENVEQALEREGWLEREVRED